MKRLEIAKLEEAKKLIRTEIHRTDESRLQHRLHCVLLLCDGKKCSEVSELFGDSLRVLQNWIKEFNKAGIDGLRDHNRPGRTPKLSSEDLARLNKDLRTLPRDLGYYQNLWDGKLLSHHIKTCYGIELKVRQCQNLLHDLGFRRRKPRPLIAKADPEKQEAFKKN